MHATIWMKHENVTLSERSQPQRTIPCMIPFILTVQNRQIQRDKKIAGAEGGRDEM